MYSFFKNVVLGELHILIEVRNDSWSLTRAVHWSIYFLVMFEEYKLPVNQKFINKFPRSQFSMYFSQDIITLDNILKNAVRIERMNIQSIFGNFVRYTIGTLSVILRRQLIIFNIVVKWFIIVLLFNNGFVQWRCNTHAVTALRNGFLLSKTQV